MSFDATVLTMFPEAFPGPLGVSLIGTAWREQGLWTLETVDIRTFSKDKRGFLDDTPAGGGPGQVMRADVIASALDSVERDGRPLLYMSARGRPLTQAMAADWSKGAGPVVRCGRFAGGGGAGRWGGRGDGGEGGVRAAGAGGSGPAGQSRGGEFRGRASGTSAV